METTDGAQAPHAAAASEAERLRQDLDSIRRISAVDPILKLVCRSSGMRFAAVARVTDSNWTACAVHDALDFGLKPGDELPVRSTLCDTVRDLREAVVIDHVDEDPIYREHHTPALYGFQSYISVPIFRADGSFFGTLCALDPRPTKIKGTATVTMFTSFAELIGAQLDADEKLETGKADLLTSKADLLTSQANLATSQADLIDARKVAELREQFIAVLGHDLRNPLQAIGLNVEFIQRKTTDEKILHHAGSIRASADRMAKLIANLMDFSRGRLGGGIVLEKKPAHDLEAMLQQVTSELIATHGSRAIRLNIRIDRPVHCDTGRIGQVLSNLLANALTHGDPHQPVAVDVDCHDTTFRIAVSNGGEPIPQDKLARLFDPFTRMSAGRSEGLGLGLYIASEIARAHGGSLQVASDTEGTRFWMEMPVQ